MIGRNHLRGSFHFDEGRAWLNQLMTVLEYWDPLQFWHTSSDSSHWVRRYTKMCRIQWWIKTASPWSSRQSNLYSSFILPSRNLGLYPFYPFYPPSSHIRDQLLRAHRLPRRAPIPKCASLNGGKEAIPQRWCARSEGINRGSERTPDAFVACHLGRIASHRFKRSYKLLLGESVMSKETDSNCCSTLWKLLVNRHASGQQRKTIC